ncbi:formin-2-like [Corvus moneduloides]|uniref:formin-2-like n=1 Tax=Corvus moneduloides TaxID=1196302 RepID=UPI001363E086|nr:formin-2-like [Corvus moneduloides]
MFHSISGLNAGTNPTICTTKGSYSRSAMLASLPNKTQHTKASIFSNCAINNHIRFISLVNAVSRDCSPVDLVREFKGPSQLSPTPPAENSGTGAPVPAALPPARPVPQQRCSHSQSCGFAGSPTRTDGATLPRAPGGRSPPFPAAGTERGPAGPPGAGGCRRSERGCRHEPPRGGCRTPRHSSSLPPRRELLFLLPPTLPKRCSAPPAPLPRAGPQRGHGVPHGRPLPGLRLGLPGRRLPPQDVLPAGKCPRRAAAAGCQARSGTARAGRRAGPVTGAGPGEGLPLPPAAARPAPPRPAPPYLPAGRDEEGPAPHTRPGRGGTRAAHPAGPLAASLPAPRQRRRK